MMETIFHGESSMCIQTQYTCVYRPCIHTDTDTDTDTHTHHTHTHTHTPDSHTHRLTHTHTHTHTPHTHTTHTRLFCEKWGTSQRRNGFYTVQNCVLLPYTYPTPKLSPHRRLRISTFPQKTDCMIYKHFEKWGHWAMSWKVTFTL